MKLIKLLIVFFVGITSVYSQTFYDFPGDIIPRQFYEQYPMAKIDYEIGWIDYNKNGEPIYDYGDDISKFDWRQIDFRLYTYEVVAFGNKYTIQYYEKEDFGRNIIEINNQKYYVETSFYADGRIDGFWTFEYMNHKYLSFKGQINTGNAWAPWLIMIFDITNTDNIRFIVFDSFVFTDEPEIGIYDGKLCGIKTTYSEREDGSRWSRLYSIEGGIFKEIFDKNRKNIELYFDWNRHTYDTIKIYDKNIP